MLAGDTGAGAGAGVMSAGGEPDIDPACTRPTRGEVVTRPTRGIGAADTRGEPEPVPVDRRPGEPGAVPGVMTRISPDAPPDDVSTVGFLVSMLTPGSM